MLIDNWSNGNIECVICPVPLSFFLCGIINSNENKEQAGSNPFDEDDDEPSQK